MMMMMEVKSAGICTMIKDNERNEESGSVNGG